MVEPSARITVAGDPDDGAVLGATVTGGADIM
jgi:hypothetical protein